MKAIILLTMTCALALSASASAPPCGFFNYAWNTCITPEHLMDICPVSCSCEMTPGVSSGGSSKHTFGVWLAGDDRLLYDYPSFLHFLDTTSIRDLRNTSTSMERDLRIIQQELAWLREIVYHEFGYTPPSHLWR